MIPSWNCRAEAGRLAGLRLSATEDRIEAELALGGTARWYPSWSYWRHESLLVSGLVGQLMLALYRCGRQAGALAAYRAVRCSLVEELGLEPGPELRRLEAAVLAQDPALDLPPRPAAPPRSPAAAPPAPPRRRPWPVLAAVALLAAASVTAGWCSPVARPARAPRSWRTVPGPSIRPPATSRPA